MIWFLLEFVINLALLSTFNILDESSTITSCEGSTKYGPNIQIDFYKINRTCTCTVSPSFAGKLLVISKKEIYLCSTKVYVTNNEKTVSFGCQSEKVSSDTFNVLINKSVEVREKDESSSTSGTFFYCLGFQQNGKYAHITTRIIIHKKVHDYYNNRWKYFFSVFIDRDN